MRISPKALLPYGVLALFCAASLLFRPLLPPDETRYLTVAWEMFLRDGWFVPTLNFAPYHHKPPLLFWLLDTVWAMFGVGRPQAMVAVFAISASVLYLTRRVARALFPARDDIARRLDWLMLGNVVFVIYASLILFDLLLTACVLAAFLYVLAFARGGGGLHAALAGLTIGVGVLAKGPVMLIHVAWPVLLYPLWRTGRETLEPRAFYRGMALSLLAALAPVAIWLGPALIATDGQFAYELLWKQSAGRISGNMEASHPRPVYFYLLMLPVLGMPWIFSPTVWKAARLVRPADVWNASSDETRYVRLLVLWAAGIVLTFSLISGKQPHYILPILPLATIVFGWIGAPIPVRAIRRGALIVVGLFVVGQAAASVAYFPRYDLTRVAAFIDGHPGKRFGVLGGYQGEYGFLARLRDPVAVVDPDDADAWLTANPGAFLIDARKRYRGTLGEEALAMPYRSRTLSIRRAPP